MKNRFAGFQPVRRDRLLQESRHDPYEARRKLPEPTVCPDCGAVFHGGRWQWLASPVGAHKASCPACQRQREKMPAGYVSVSGDFFNSHREELLQLIHNEEKHAKAAGPLKRILDITDENGGVLVTTTDIHLARALGDALHRACQGELEYHYNEQEHLLRVAWRR